MGDRKLYSRDDALLAAMKVFWRFGYHGTSMQKLSTVMQINPKSLYTEFENKETLFEEALTLYTKAGLEQARCVLEKKPLGLHNIKTYFRAMKYENECRGCLMTMTINERQLVSKQSITLVSSTLHLLEKLLLKNLNAEGFNKAKSKRIATFLIFSIQGITTMGKLEGNNARLANTIKTILSVLKG